MSSKFRKFFGSPLRDIVESLAPFESVRSDRIVEQLEVGAQKVCLLSPYAKKAVSTLSQSYLLIKI